jgi:transposase
MQFEEDDSSLWAENRALRQRVAELEAGLKAAQDLIQELAGQKKEPPSWVKPNKPKKKPEEKKSRRKRAAEQNGARRREEPTRVVEHKLERCADCGYGLHWPTEMYRRQVVEMPPPPLVEVTDHVVIKQWCPHCEGWKAPKLDLRDEVLGQGRIGVRLTSLIVYLREVLRVPVRGIRAYLEHQHGVRVSIGEVVELLHRVAEHGKGAVEALKAEVRGGDVVHMDETGWRENGQNGYVWAMSVPGECGVQIYQHHQSRGSQVVRGLLGERFRGVLCSDFLGSYNIYRGPHQRCWVHLLRDLHKLKEEYKEQAEVVSWARGVRALYDEAQAFVRATSPPGEEARCKQYEILVAKVDDLGLRYAQAKKHPCQALAKRLLRHRDELFQFMLHARVTADNNLAERGLRPLVVVRKISGGTRSARGTATRMVMASLVATWLVRGQNPLEECLKLLQQTSLA